MASRNHTYDAPAKWLYNPSTSESATFMTNDYHEPEAVDCHLSDKPFSNLFGLRYTNHAVFYHEDEFVILTHLPSG